MKIKKLIRLVLVTILSATLLATLMTGCTTSISDKEAFDLLKNAIALSLSGDKNGPHYNPSESATNGFIFAYKESVRSDNTITNTNVNVHCEQDEVTYALKVDDDLMVDLYQETYGINSVTSGAGTKIGDFGFIVGPYPDGESANERLYYTENNTDKSGNYTDKKLRVDMTAEEFIDTDLFQRYSLSSRLEELRNMPFDAFVFDGEDYGAYHQINLVKITFGVTQEYIDNYRAETGKASIFEGCTYAEIEVTFNRISNIYVYRTESLGSDFFNLPQEMYSLQITYLGKNISFPDDNGGYTYDANLLYRTDCAFAKV